MKLYMKLNELKEGEIYKVKWNGLDHVYIMEAGSGHNIYDGQAFYMGGEFGGQKTGYEPASYVEVQWLRECIKKGEFIPLDRIEFQTYEIY